MGPTQLVTQNHGKKTSVFNMEEKVFALFQNSEIPSELI
ncbi:putative Oxysterols receptor LXR-alpha-like protein, partial [Naja naja]